MDIAFLLVLPGLLWVQAWYYLGYYPNTRTLGLVGIAVAVVLLGIVLFRDQLPVTPVYPEQAPEFLPVGATLSALILVWAVYSALVASVYLWGLDTRSLGFYSLAVAVISVLFAAYFFLGGEILDTGDVNRISWLLGTVSILLAIPAALQFFYLATVPMGRPEPTSSVMRTVTGWIYMVFSIAVAVLGGLLLLGLNPAL